jgi:8-oxo-dGTP pyrophosphatase MutT (NUDIX family)
MGNATQEPAMRERVIERLARYRPGRRGFGGADDPEEAAAFRRVLAADRELSGMTPPSAALTPAAVLVPLIDHASGMAVLLTQRTTHLSAHAGQIAFPGGRIEPGDADAVAAALRETAEEVGLPPERVSVTGRLDTYLTGTGFEITPIVGIVEPPVPIDIDPFEVAEAFEVPLAFILDRRNHQRVERESGGRRRAFFVLPYEGRNIWGATAGILVNLAEVLAG